MDRRAISKGDRKRVTPALVSILHGDVLDRLKDIPDGSVQCVVTSPPYYALRIYQVENEIGQESTPALYVEKMVSVFREIKRVLRDDGIAFCNIGDSFNAAGRGGHGTLIGCKQRTNRASADGSGCSRPTAPGMPGKTLLLIPERLAVALSDDGWIIRSHIVWAKNSCMPESCKDRPTSSWEHIWMLAKSQKYYWDGFAIAEQTSFPVPKNAKVSNAYSEGSGRDDGGKHRSGGFVTGATRNARNVWRMPAEDTPEADVWTINAQPFKGAHFACVDEETECLTTTGWKRHNDLRIGMLAAQFNVTTERLSWAPIEGIARYDVSGQVMITGLGRSLDMCLTPNHRTVIKRRDSTTRLLKAPIIVEANSLRSSHAIPTAAEWDFAGDTSVPLSWAELLGWYVAEGHACNKTLSVEIYQSETANPAKCLRIEHLLTETGAEWTKATADREWRGRPAKSVVYRVVGYAAARLREMAPGKLVPWATLLWSEDQITALLNGLIGGDGHIRLDGRRCFTQKNLDQCGLMQALAMRLGLSAIFSVRKNDGTGAVFLTKHNSRSFRSTNDRGGTVSTKIYSGVVWCPKTPQGTWVARRNGRPFITGNTFPQALPARCIQAATSERGRCPHCGAPWVRIVEKGEPDIEHQLASGADTSGEYHGESQKDYASAGAQNASDTKRRILEGMKTKITVGWKPTCACPEHEPAPCIVLDCFSGAGTTLLAARNLGRDSVGIEANADYCGLANARVGGDAFDYWIW
jgi:DNA modification methylase